MEAAWERGRAIYVPGIPFSASDGEIVAIFERVGPVEAFRRASPGFGFLLFRRAEDAAAAVAQRDFPCRGRVMDVQMAQRVTAAERAQPARAAEDELVTVVRRVPEEAGDAEVVAALERQHGPLAHYARSGGMVFVDFTERGARESLLRTGLRLEGLSGGGDRAKEALLLPAVPGTSVTRVKIPPDRGPGGAPEKKGKGPPPPRRGREGREHDFYVQNINHDAPTEKLRVFLEEHIGPIANLRRLKPKDAFAFVEFKDHDAAVARLADPELDLFFYGRLMSIRLALGDKPAAKPAEQPTGASSVTQHERDEAQLLALLRSEVRHGPTELAQLEELLAARNAALAAHVRRGYGTLADFVASRPELVLEEGRVRRAAAAAAAASAPAPRSASPVHSSVSAAPSPAAAAAAAATSPAATVALVECPQCRTYNLPNFIYCCSCGVKRGPPRCAVCQAENLVSFRFCSSCGRPNLV